MDHVPHDEFISDAAHGNTLRAVFLERIPHPVATSSLVAPVMVRLSSGQNWWTPWCDRHSKHETSMTGWSRLRT